MLRLLRLLSRLGIALICISVMVTTTGAKATNRPWNGSSESFAIAAATATRNPMVSPPPSYEPNFSEWTPCSDAESLTRSEWANCSTAYTVDRMRGNLTVGLWLLVGLSTATFLLTAVRRR